VVVNILRIVVFGVPYARVQCSTLITISFILIKILEIKAPLQKKHNLDQRLVLLWRATCLVLIVV